MISNNNNILALFFALLFMTIIAAPILVVSIDDTVDVTIFYGENEEEEIDNFKLIFNHPDIGSEQTSVLEYSKENEAYFLKHYPEPYRNIIFPPPDTFSYF